MPFGSRARAATLWASTHYPAPPLTASRLPSQTQSRPTPPGLRSNQLTHPTQTTQPPTFHSTCAAPVPTTAHPGLTTCLVQATNTHLRLLTRRSYGFHSPEALIAMAFLTRGGLCPDLPGRAA